MSTSRTTRGLSFNTRTSMYIDSVHSELLHLDNYKGHGKYWNHHSVRMACLAVWLSRGYCWSCERRTTKDYQRRIPLQGLLRKCPYPIPHNSLCVFGRTEHDAMCFSQYTPSICVIPVGIHTVLLPNCSSGRIAFITLLFIYLSLF